MILLVEDNAGDVLLLETALADSGAAVPLRVAATAAEALGVLREGAPVDLVVVDLRLPGQDGWVVLEELADGRIPVAVLSSSAREDDRARAAQYGVGAYLVKPARFEAYSRLVQDLLELRSAHR